MTKTRNQFTTEFKQECVHLVVSQGYGVAQAAKAMGRTKATCVQALSKPSTPTRAAHLQYARKKGLALG